MGLLDKAKQQAQQLATKAQDGLNQGQQKLDATQNKKSVEAWLRDLGAWTYAQWAGRDEGRADAEIEVLINQIQGWEAQFGAISMPFPSPGTGAGPGGPAPGPAPAMPTAPGAPEAPAAPTDAPMPQPPSTPPVAPPPAPPPDFGASPPGASPPGT